MRLSTAACTLALLGLACSEAEEPASLTKPDASAVLCSDGCPEGMRCNGGVCEPEVKPDAGTPRGRAVVEPAEINFGAFALGVPVEVTLVVANQGQGDLEVLALEIESNAAGELQILTAEPLPKVLPPDESLAARVKYQATDGVEDHDRLRVI
ncbi:MAG: hypothetical protein HYZ27_09135, partial [Deltaproteobacteria bacterium]|nr:hypothetical protein [Deltaproteobacteria bacterium]